MMIESYAILFFLALLSFNELFGKNIIFARKIFGPIIMLAMAVLCLIRGGIAGDYVTYKTSFEIIIDPNDFFYPTNYFYEPLYSLLQLCVKAVVDDFQVFCLVIGSIVLLLQYKFAMMYRPGKVLPTHKDSGIVSFSNGMVCIKRCYKNICYSSVVQGEYYFTIFFILWGLYRANIVTIRSSIALCICLYAIKYIEERNICRFLLSVIIACGFHYSAAIYFPAYYIFWIHCSMKKKIVTMIICSVAFFNGMEYAMNMFGGMIGGQLGEKVLVYAYNAGDFMAGTGAEGSDDGLMLWVKAVANIGLLLIVGLYLWKNNKNIRQYEGGLNLYLVGCILYISTMSINHAFARLSIYYNVFQVPMLLFLVSKGKYKTGYRIMCWMFLFVYIVFRFSVNMAAGPEIKYFWE